MIIPLAKHTFSDLTPFVLEYTYIWRSYPELPKEHLDNPIQSNNVLKAFVADSCRQISGSL